MATLGENKMIVRRFIEEFINNKNTAAAEELVSEKSTDEAQESLMLFLILSSFPDLRVNIERMVAEGNRVAVLATFGGTHEREFIGVKPTGKGVLGRMINIFTVDDRKITSVLYNFDLINLMTQLGGFPQRAVYHPEEQPVPVR